jgi:hypothetical protein
MNFFGGEENYKKMTAEWLKERGKFGKRVH